jgi:hypothetical protein
VDPDSVEAEATTSFKVTLNPPPGGSGGSGAPTLPGSKGRLTVAVKGHNVRGHVPTSDTAEWFTVYRVHGKRLKVLRTGKTSKTGYFNLHFSTQVSGSFEVRSGFYQARFTINRAVGAKRSKT